MFTKFLANTPDKLEKGTGAYRVRRHANCWWPDCLQAWHAKSCLFDHLSTVQVLGWPQVPYIKYLCGICTSQAFTMLTKPRGTPNILTSEENSLWRAVRRAVAPAFSIANIK